MTKKELFDKLSCQFFSVYSVNKKKFVLNKDGSYECFPASVTKALNALVACKYLKPDDKLIVGEEQDIMHLSPDPSVAGIEKGEVWTFRDILYASLLPSGNDAAYTIGYNVAKRLHPEETNPKKLCKIYAKMMNDYAKSIGCKRTHFETLDGNDYVRGRVARHLTSTNDICLIFNDILKEKELVNVMATAKKDIKIGEKEYHFVNTNKLIQKDSEYYNPYLVGGKTGFTSLAGCCLGAIVKKDDEVYTIAICFSDNGIKRNQDANMIIDYLFKGARHA